MDERLDCSIELIDEGLYQDRLGDFALCNHHVSPVLSVVFSRFSLWSRSCAVSQAKGGFGRRSKKEKGKDAMLTNLYVSDLFGSISSFRQTHNVAMALIFRFTYLFCICSLLYTRAVSPFLIHRPKHQHAFAHSFLTRQIPPHLNHDHLSSLRNDDGSDFETTARTEHKPIGLYSMFAEYAWNKLLSAGLLSITDVDHITRDSAIQKVDSSFVRIHVVSARPPKHHVIRYTRYALLETLIDSTNPISFTSLNGTQVLNFVIFPQPNMASAIPILGIDLVTLPGGKNLCAIDFQPILLHGNYGDYLQTWPDQYIPFRDSLKQLHSKFVKDRNITWGGDVPDEAYRFFSPYALWTRFKSENEFKVLHEDIFPAFTAYVDLYIDLLLRVQSDQYHATMNNSVQKNSDDDSIQHIIQGHRDYLRYRTERDPARPMLRKLFGEEWTENLIQSKLFPIDI